MAGVLSRPERAGLARAMFEDVWAALRRALQAGEELDRLLAVSSEPYVIARCRKAGVACLEETEQLSHSDSVNRATRWAMDLGATSLLSVPIDTPAVSEREILALCEFRRRFGVVVVPARDGRGTNALLRTPPDAVAAHFGPDSCRLHVQEAGAKGLSCLVVPSPGLSADLDTAEDLKEFSAAGIHCRSRRLVRKLLSAPQGIAACLC
jgi:2-phospho-L-lactate guanylyltransferase